MTGDGEQGDDVVHGGMRIALYGLHASIEGQELYGLGKRSFRRITYTCPIEKSQRIALGETTSGFRRRLSQQRQCSVLVVKKLVPFLVAPVEITQYTARYVPI